MKANLKKDWIPRWKRSQPKNKKGEVIIRKPLYPPHLTNNMRMIVRAETRAVKKEQTR